MKGLAGPPQITVAGHVAVDQVFDRKDQVAPRLSLGGPASYSSITLASLGYPTKIVTKIGEDFPTGYARLLRDRGHLAAESYVAKGRKTTSFKIDRHSVPRRLWLMDRCEDLFLSDFPETDQSSALVVNTIVGEVSPEVLSEVARRYRHVFLDSQGFVRSFSATGEVGMRKGLELEPLDGVEFLKGDEEELLAWTGGTDVDAAIAKLSKYVRYVILTGGARHVRIFDGGRLAWRAAPPPVSVEDTTGAGDIFLAVFAGTYSEHGDVEASLARASCAASLALETKGIEKAILSGDLLEKSVRGTKVVRY